MRPYGFSMGPYNSTRVFMDSNRYLCVLIVSYSPLWILMGPFKSVCVLMDSNGTLWVLVNNYAAV